MKVTFFYNKMLQVRFEADECSFEFVTESYHQFLAATKDVGNADKKKLRLTFEKSEQYGN